MEKQIEKIIIENIEMYSSGCTDNVADGLLYKACAIESAKEITSHVIEFIEWLGNSGYQYHASHKMWIAAHRYTTEELYHKWLINIHNK
jgi:hypothetical protein